MMKLWILEKVDELPPDDDPWYDFYDKVLGFVVRAETEEEARRFADKNAEDENFKRTPWLDKRYSTCNELLSQGPAGVIMKDFYAA